jgi:Anti-sigma factor NepR
VNVRASRSDKDARSRELRVPEVIQRSTNYTRGLKDGNGRPRHRQRASAPERIKDLLGEHLRLYYAELIKEPMPGRLTALLERLAERERRS